MFKVCSQLVHQERRLWSRPYRPQLVLLSAWLNHRQACFSEGCIVSKSGYLVFAFICFLMCQKSKQWGKSPGPPCLPWLPASPTPNSDCWLVCVSFQSLLTWIQMLFLLPVLHKKAACYTHCLHMHCILEWAFSSLKAAECPIVWIGHVFFNQLLTDKQLCCFQFSGSHEVIPKYMINDSIINFCLHSHSLEK